MEHRTSTAARLRGNLKMVVYTAKTIKESIAEAQADTKRDTTAVVNQLNVNLTSIMQWGKNLQENIRFLEGKD